MEYVWKINTIDGKSFYVESNEKDLAKFTINILPRDGKETISTFNCENKEVIKGTGIKFKYNSVVIVGSKVSSVEFYQDKSRD